MHRDKAREAEKKREKVCNSKASAESERMAMQAQVKAAVDRHDELMKFAEYKELQATQKNILSHQQK